MDEDEFPLADLLTELSRNLREANRRALEGDEAALVKVDSAVVELGITWERSGSGHLDFMVVRLGGGLGKSDVQTMTVTLTPAGGDPLVVRGEIQSDHHS